MAAQLRTVDDDEHVATLAGVDYGAALLAMGARAPCADRDAATWRRCPDPMTAFAAVMASITLTGMSRFQGWGDVVVAGGEE